MKMGVDMRPYNECGGWYDEHPVRGLDEVVGKGAYAGLVVAAKMG